MDKNHNILILASVESGSGNKTTAERIQSYLQNETDFTCELIDIRTKSNWPEKKCKVVLAVHAFRCSTLLKECTVPYILIFGGTDVNEFSKNMEHLKIMTETVKRARYLVCFSSCIYNKVLLLWPDQKNVVTIPPGVYVCPNLKFAKEWRTRCKISNDAIVFTLVGGIRPVKDPCFLLEAFSQWHKVSSYRVNLVIVGGMADQKFGNSVFLNALERSTGVVYLGCLDQCDVHGIMSDSFAVVNSSLSEGLAQAIQEAMALGVVVIARRIEANEALVRDYVTGLLYDTPEEFVAKASSLIVDNTSYQRMATNCRNLMETVYRIDQESQSYCNLVRQLLQ